MTVRFLQPWNGHMIGDVATLTNEAALIAGGIARDSSVVDGPHQGANSIVEYDESSGALVVKDSVQFSTAAFGPKTVLFGDSMTDYWEEGVAITAASFNTVTGVMTCTLANHYLWTGKTLRVFSYTYPSIRVGQDVTVTRISSSQFSFVLTGATDVPASPDYTKIMIQGRSKNQIVSWVGCLQMRNGHKLNIVKNLAQNGESSIGLYARVGDVLALAPELVLMQMTGINDETHPTDSCSEETTNTYNAMTIDAILGAGIKLVLCLITPVGSGEARATKAAMARVIRKNTFLKSYCKGKKNVIVVDSYAQVIDPTNTSGLGLDNCLRSDHIHYSTRGALKVAKEAEKAVNAWFPVVASTLPQSPMDSGDGGKLTVTSATSSADVVTINSTAHGWRVGDTFFVKKMTEAAANGVFTVKAAATNSFTYDAPGTGTATLTAGSVVVTRSPQAFGNPLLLTATGGNVGNGLTGVAASKLQISNQAGNTGTLTAVGSVPVAQSGFGNEQLVTITAAAANDEPCINTYGTSSFMGDLQLNRKYTFESMLRLSSNSWPDTPISEIYSRVSVTWSTGETYAINVTTGWDVAEAVSITEDQTLHLKSGSLALAPPQAGATLTAATWTNYIRFSGPITNSKTLLMGLSQIAMTDAGAA